MAGEWGAKMADPTGIPSIPRGGIVKKLAGTNTFFF
jgi:hypothetical protein